MDRVLEKIAKQLMAFDEASLSTLWEKYAAQVEQFEPTKRWEEAAIVLGLIQTVRWKNQLFNYHWKETADPQGVDGPVPDLISRAPFESVAGKKPSSSSSKAAKVLHFKLRDDEEDK